MYIATDLEDYTARRMKLSCVTKTSALHSPGGGGGGGHVPRPLLRTYHFGLATPLIYMYICMFVCMSVCMYVCMYVYTYNKNNNYLNTVIHTLC